MTSEEQIAIAGGIMLLLGVLLLLAGLYFLYYFKIGKKKKCTVETVGTVVDQAGSTNQLYPVIEYEANGKVYRKKNSASVTTTKFGSINVSNGYERGQQVTVHYDPDKPTRWYINDSKEQLILPLMFILGGVVLMVLGGVMPLMG